MEQNRGDEINDSPIEEVRLTVPITDDQTLKTLTFRTWTLGLTACIGLSFINRFLDYRQNPIYLSADFAQIVFLPLGNLMAAVLPTKNIRIPGTKWTFTMNPGPFNVKEHALIMVFAIRSLSFPIPVLIMTIMKAFFHRNLSPLSILILSHISQMLGYGFIGLLQNLFVDNPRMWWPSRLVSVSLFRALHEVEVRAKGQLSTFQFFLIAFVGSFAYYIVPSYFFPSITALSFVCWIWKDSVTAQQIGSGRHGLGIGSFLIDYTTINSYVGNPFATPIDTILNSVAGFFLILYVAVPIAYWTNSFNATRFPIVSSSLFDADGQEYNVSRVLDKETFTLDKHAYHNYSQVYLSIMYAISYAVGFAGSAALVTHFLLNHGRSTWSKIKEAYRNQHKEEEDVHNRLMSKYEPVPKWWYHIILISSVAAAILMSTINNQFQLPVWAVLLAISINLIFIIPVGTITATTNMTPFPSDLTDMVIYYLFSGKPLAVLTYGAYSSITMLQTLHILGDLKLGYYMKIPPKSMFTAQIVSSLVSTSVHVGTAWWVLSTVKNVCDPSKLPTGSPWTCPGEEVLYNRVVQHGVVGPAHLFVPQGLYWWAYIFYAVGIVLTIIAWKLSRVSSKKWVGLINVPIILTAVSNVPPTGPVHFWSWAAVGIFFNFYVYKKFKGWWAKYNYVLSAGLNVGPAFVSLLLYFALSRQGIYGVNWWGLAVDDHCTLAHCPTAKGIAVDGCPTFH